MDQRAIELILLRQWASYMAIALWVMDAEGTLVFYNGPAEDLLGIRFDEAGEIRAEELASMFSTTDLDGTPLPAEQLPVVIALVERVAAHRKLRFVSGDGTARTVAVTAIPLEGQGGRFLGAMAAFWEPSSP